ncbi:hypothetical protein AX16_006291 [Volvariella volvacea WC 439]|nr:hypothetical protein AX16_006291 [Volvariella volvacea WC 439]
MSSVPATQKALILDVPQGNFAVQDTEVHTPNAGEVLVKVQSAALNPVDWKIHKKEFFKLEYPAVLGTDVAGDVVKVGDGVTRFKLGDKMALASSTSNRYTGYQQYSVTEQHFAAKIPDNVSYDEAATIPVTITAAYLSFYDRLGLTPPTPTHGGAGKYAGIPFVVIGGSSSVGQLGIQLAKLSGFSPIITYASSKHDSFLKSLGATHVIDRTSVPLTSLPSAVHAITGPSNTPYAFDAISAPETQQAGYDVLSKGGKLGIVLYLDENLKQQEGSGKQILPVIGVKNYPEFTETLTDAYLFLEEWVRNGTIKPNRVEILPGGLKDIPDGLKRLENNQVSGVKLVVRPGDVVEGRN